MSFFFGVKKKLMILTVLTLVPFFTTGTGLTTFFMLREQVQQQHQEEKVLLRSAKGFLQNRINIARSDILFLVDAMRPYLAKDLKTNSLSSENRDALYDFMSNFLESKKIYGQLRIIDLVGFERGRVDYISGRSKIVSEKNLQKKSNRYYYKEALAVGKGEVYISQLDLNMENNRIELPYNPMLRFISPIYRGDDKIGLVILNYYGNELIDDLVSTMPESRGFWMIVNNDGTYIYNEKSPEKIWGMVDPDSRTGIFTDFPEHSKSLMDNSQTTLAIEGTQWDATPIQMEIGSSRKILTLIHLVRAPSVVSILRSLSWFVFLIPLGALISGLCIAMYGGIVITRPIQELSRTMTGYAAGKRELRVQSINDDEFGTLSRIFNDMANKLSDLYANLESQVAKRTKELEMANHQLERSEAINAAIIDNTLEGIVSADIQGNILGFNKAAEGIFGYKASEVVGRSVTMLQPSPYREEHASYVDRYLLTGERRIMGEGREAFGLRKDGSKFPVHLGVSEVVVGRERFFTATLRDLTEIRKAEKAAQISQARFRATFDQAAVGLAHVGLDGSWIRINDKLCEIVGYPRSELIHKTFQDITHPDDLATDLELVGKVISGEIQNYRMEKRYWTKDGGLVWVNLTVSLMRDIDGEPIHFISVIEDISKRKQMDEALRRTRLSVDRSREGIYWVRPDGSIFDVNDGAVRQIGREKDALLTLSINEILPDLDSEHLTEVFERARKLEGVSFETMLRRSDGTRLAVELVTYFLIAEETHFMCCFISDITERKRSEQSLIDARNEAQTAQEIAEAASQAKSNFLASMSHELRTPLNAVIGFAEVLQDKYFGPLTEKQDEYIVDILQSGQHLLALINDVLDLSKIEAGKMEIQLSQFDLDMLLSTSLIYIREKAKKHNIELVTDFPEDIGMVSADERKIKQVLFNLLSNASKFTPDGGQITLAASRLDFGSVREKVPETLWGELASDQSDWLLVSITDTGIGIDESQLFKIFDSFYQVKSGKIDKTPGTGLGLPLSAQLLRLQGGTIWAESSGEDQGSRFVFVFPGQQSTNPRPENQE